MYLAAVSKFILNAYEFGDATAPLPDGVDGEDEAAISAARGNNTPYLSE